VEAGAYDGEVFSNSLFFELKLGWKGLLVEPNPDALSDLVINSGILGGQQSDFLCCRQNEQFLIKLHQFMYRYTQKNNHYVDCLLKQIIYFLKSGTLDT
jgi:hypothetical protein